MAKLRRTFSNMYPEGALEDPVAGSDFGPEGGASLLNLGLLGDDEGVT